MQQLNVNTQINVQKNTAGEKSKNTLAQEGFLDTIHSLLTIQENAHVAPMTQEDITVFQEILAQLFSGYLTPPQNNTFSPELSNEALFYTETVAENKGNIPPILGLETVPIPVQMGQDFSINPQAETRLRPMTKVLSVPQESAEASAYLKPNQAENQWQSTENSFLLQSKTAPIQEEKASLPQNVTENSAPKQKPIVLEKEQGALAYPALSMEKNHHLFKISDHAVVLQGEKVDTNPLIDKIISHISKENMQFEISLYPKELGKVLVNMVLEKDVIKMTILCDKGDTAKALANGFPKLSTVLEKQMGFEVQVTYTHTAENETRGFNQEFSQKQQGHFAFSDNNNADSEFEDYINEMIQNSYFLTN